MSSLNWCRVIFAGAALGGGFPAFADSTPSEVKATTLSYDVDAALTYIDAARRPDTGAIQASPPVAMVEQPRTLGLEHLKLGLDWRTVEGAALRLVLRPDAANHAQSGDSGAPVRELDTRSGAPYRPMPTVRLLDSYQLTVKPGTSLDLALGVFENLLPSQAAYPEVLAFGLEVRTPAKFSAVRVRWHRQEQGADTLVGTASGFHVDLYVLHGDEDRAEQQGGRKGSFDRAPVGQDPYYGGAAQFGWQPSRRVEWNLLGGYGDAAAIGGRRNEIYTELAGVGLLPVASRDLKLALDLKAVREKWRGAAVNIKNREQRSADLTASLPTVPGLWYVLGAAMGVSERPVSEQAQDETVAVRGYQASTGFLSQVGKGLTLEFMVSQERRTTSDAAGNLVGAFVDEAGSHSTIRRLGLTLRYEGNG